MDARRGGLPSTTEVEVVVVEEVLVVGDVVVVAGRVVGVGGSVVGGTVEPITGRLVTGDFV